MINPDTSDPKANPLMWIQDPEKAQQTFLDAYITCALWASTDFFDEEGRPLPEEAQRGEESPLEDLFTAADLSPSALAVMTADCERFIQENIGFLATRDPGYGGHDFWLTRNGHGAGFWDGDWLPAAGESLTEAAAVFGESNLYVGDDGSLYIQNDYPLNEPGVALAPVPYTTNQI